MILTFLCAAGTCKFCGGETSGPDQCEHPCHGRPAPRMVESWDPPEPAIPRCGVCRDTGQVWSADPGGESMSDQACPACDAPYPAAASDPSAEDPFGGGLQA